MTPNRPGGLAPLRPPPESPSVRVVWDVGGPSQPGPAPAERAPGDGADEGVPGGVDGWWWPRTPDLYTELAALLPTMLDEGRLVGHVAYNASSWRSVPRSMTVRGHVVGLHSWLTLPPDVVRFLVVPSGIVRLAVVRPEVAHD